MNHKPYQVGTVVLVDNFNYDEFTIVSYHTMSYYQKGKYIESLIYIVKRVDGQLWRVDHQMIRLKDAQDEVVFSENLSTDELLEAYQNYKGLYTEFGDNEYLNKLHEIENKLKNKLYNRR